MNRQHLRLVAALALSTLALAASCAAGGRGSGGPPAPREAATVPGVATPGKVELGVTGDARGWGDQYFDKFRALGAASAREEWDSGDTDSAPLAAAAARGLSVLPLLQPKGGQNTSDWNAARDWLADFARKNVAGGSFWAGRKDADLAPTSVELVNEPYADSSSNDDPDPATYARFVAAVVPAMRAANPRVRILLAADTTPANSKQDWVAAMYTAVPDLNRYFDGIAVHPYGFDPVAQCDPKNDVSFCRIETLRARFVDRGAADKKFWITEIGSPTGGGSADHAVQVSEKVQAEYLRGYIAKADAYGYVQALYVYHYRDLDCSDSVECYFGLTRNDGSQKPAWRVFHDSAVARGQSDGAA